MKYRKKPIVIEAEQWFPEKENKDVHIGYEEICGGTCKYHYIKTLEGDMQIRSGDWLITGVEGEKYPCKDSIFQATYEKVEE